MNKTWLKVIILLFTLSEALAAYFIINRIPQPEQDTVAVNSTLQYISSHWDEMSALKYKPITIPGCPYSFSVLGKDGQVITSSGEKFSHTIHDAIINRDTILDIVTENTFQGKLLIYNEEAKRLSAVRKYLFFSLFCFGFIEIFFFLAFYLYYNKNFILPFQKLKVFAVRVAGGDLDFPLTMDRSHAFGAFTESFDLMREELKKARELERAATQSKKELVAKLSHDIKTPVASIKAVSELMLVNARSEKEKHQLAVIDQKASQIDRLISDLFHATLEELEELPVTPVIQSSLILPMLLSAADYQNKSTVKAVPECMLNFDKLRLTQVFDNIFSNSYKYADTPIHISFALDHEMLFIRIHDDGPGIPALELPLIFEKFYRGSNSNEKSGAGLGLFISRYLLQQMGGDITVETSSEGFAVRVCLPLA